uniref:EF-hand domain-containing protein n=1 Tax=Chlamydomonas leiostraca TaxID=1034604 RepID=A0A7S0S0D9_9CHLO|mmetsp:Transcript_36925/g.93186  ORF Transcript_36925/g.93186 Transcript_36925/m.93186 type:complete len:162 (+) Transcript_36925:65-550(+)|eukprot:CAMPEP_0202860606 /NCGR_PEP_ID=MMETSP1391-20130828/2260_1 /ASSEMBLY_ACC=CAM_ASM_000867 /TAXON_ID=1034604 /ORGANISM="Chlamydomonas leiostraca, Strain SAG 11-49" /LENGTH=161 /DNA_ID=CAMNT_0049539811 /DNA_START=40 /DNA_END=525 /DNA_ORIENTATION=+
MPRDIDALEAVPDAKLQALDKAYLERHHIDKLLNDLMINLITLKPQDPIQYMIDAVAYNSDYAKQDPITGLPEHRRAKLADVFRVIDKDGHGKVALGHLQAYATKHGGSSLGDEELASMFADFHPGEDNLVTLEQFLLFFSRVSRTIPNAAFDELVAELMA